MERKDCRVFIAEDEPLVLYGFKAIVENIGCQVVGTAMNGREAAAQILKLAPDLAIMDINMPYMDGLQAIEEVNKEIQIPFIVVTGYKDQAFLDKASQLGVFGYLSKPIDEYDIKTTIEIALARFEEFKQLRTELGDTKKALQERKIIERAKGILMEKTRLSEPQAMKHLQKLSRDRNMRLVDTAQEIIHAEELFKV